MNRGTFSVGFVLFLILLVVIMLFWGAALVSESDAQTREPRPIPAVEVREFSHGVIRIVDYDNEVVCFARDYTMSCVKMP